MLAPTDCDDQDAAVHPGAAERKGDGVDNDCDGRTDCDDDDLAGVREGDVGEADVPTLCADWCPLEVTGSVTLDATALTDLDDLACVTAIGGDLFLRENEALTSIAGLAALRSVDGNLSVGEYWCEYTDDWVCTGSGNPALLSYDGLQNLERVGGWLSLADNDAIVDPGMGFEHLWIQGWAGMSWIGVSGHAQLTDLPDFPLLGALGYVEVLGNDALLGLSGFAAAEVFQGLSVNWNPSLAAPLGLDSIYRVNASLTFSGNGNTSMAGLETLTEVTGIFEMWGNPALASLDGLNSLEAVAAWFTIAGNDALVDLSGLDSLRSVLDLNLFDNDGLLSVDGVENLSMIEGNLQIIGYLDAGGNSSLIDLQGLHGVRVVAGDVNVVDNATLSNAEAQALVGHIDFIGGTVTIDNGG